MGVGLEGAYPPHPQTMTLLALQRLSHGCEPQKRPTRKPGGRCRLSRRMRTTTPSPRLILAASPLAPWNNGHYHHHLPRPWPPAPGTGSEVTAAASLARRTSPDDRVPERLRTARANSRLRSRASSTALASTYSRDTRGTQDSRLIEGLTSPGTGGIRV